MSIGNAWDAINAAVTEASDLDRAVARHAHTMARLLVGKLRHVDGSDLAALKRELAWYNIHTGKWRKS